MNIGSEDQLTHEGDSYTTGLETNDVDLENAKSVADELNREFGSRGIGFSVTLESYKGKNIIVLWVRIPSRAHKFGIDDKIDEYTNAFGFDVVKEYTGERVSDDSGIKSVPLIIAREIIDGRINWRRWVPHIENFSEEHAGMLDIAAGIIAEDPNSVQELRLRIRSSFDKDQKFIIFLDFALEKGLLNRKEYFKIHGDAHRYYNT